MRAALALLLLMAAPAAAELTPNEAAVLPRILSVQVLDMVAVTIGEERAVLMAGAEPDTADLVVLAGAPDERAGEPLLVARGIAWTGAMAGQVAALEVSPAGGLQIVSQNTAIGRSAWTRRLTVAERDGALVVAGFTQEGYDRIDGSSLRCDWNLLSGRIIVERGDGTRREEIGVPSRVALSKWAGPEDRTPDVCRD